MRLIDADELWKAITTQIEEYCDLADLIEIIEAQATVDAEPVKQGKWINGVCNQCGSHAPYWAMASTYYRSNYCPNCGADMGGNKDE